MFVSYITGVPDAWVGDRHILHYTSDDLWHWAYQGRAELPSDRVIDACVHPVEGGWRMWYKDEADESHTHYADSPDLAHWTHRGRATEDQAQEGPNVFRLGGRGWLIADIWDGQAVYDSEDMEHWRRRGAIMAGAGTRPEDGNRAHHADVLPVDDEHAYLFYFVHPGQKQYEYDAGIGDYLKRRSSVQVAELRVVDGMLTSVRDEPFEFDLPDM